jgi:predicted DNA-binding transcriptional regulator YafY
MNRTERFYRIERILHERRVVPIEAFLQELEISRATFKRDMEYLRERLHAPIVWDRDAGGYRFESLPAAEPAHELPGLWFSAAELYALLASEQLLADLDPGILAHQIAPLRLRIAALLEASGAPAGEIARRPVEPQCFSEIALALMRRRQLEIRAWNRGRDEVNTRVVSPQRLIHYRDNWYLDAWCHWRDSLRSFSLDTVRHARALTETSRELAEAELDAHFSAAYGIFSGPIRDWAVLRFSPERARWVKSERWHPEQQGETLPDGGYRLRVPYADERELVMDILRHGGNVVVEAPESLRQSVLAEAQKIAAFY